MKIGSTYTDYASPFAQHMATERAIAGSSDNMRQQARRVLNERLRPAQSGINLREMDDPTPDIRARIDDLILGVIDDLQQRGLAGQGPVISDEEAARLRDYLTASQFGAGELEYLFHEPDVEDIVINTTASNGSAPIVEVWTYRQSGKRQEGLQMAVEDVIEIINRNAAAQGRKLDPSTPILNTQMRNGARLNAILNPVCDPYLSATIRIHRLVARSFDDLIAFGTLTQASAAWLGLCVRAHLAIVVGGGTGCGKTNLLNAIARIADPRERIVCIEDTRELDLAVRDKVYLVTVPSKDPDRRITQRDLVANALRMRPDRIVLGEVRDAAAWDAIKAATTGHDGSLLTVHAEDAAGVVNRLIRLSREAPETTNLPEHTLREAVASAFQLVIFLERIRQADGAYRRYVTEIVELNGFVSDGVVNQKKLFALQNGKLAWTQHWPHERTRRRLLEAGFTDRDIEEALKK